MRHLAQVSDRPAPPRRALGFGSQAIVVLGIEDQHWGHPHLARTRELAVAPVAHVQASGRRDAEALCGEEVDLGPRFAQSHLGGEDLGVHGAREGGRAPQRRRIGCAHADQGERQPARAEFGEELGGARPRLEPLAVHRHAVLESLGDLRIGRPRAGPGGDRPQDLLDRPHRAGLTLDRCGLPGVAEHAGVGLERRSTRVEPRVPLGSGELVHERAEQVEDDRAERGHALGHSRSSSPYTTRS